MSSLVDLSEVVSGVDPVKPPPVVDAERSKDGVVQDRATGPKPVGGFEEPLVQDHEVRPDHGSRLRKTPSLGFDRLRRLASGGEVTEGDDEEPAQTLLSGRVARLRRPLFEQAGETGGIQGIRQIEMLEDAGD